MDINKYLLTNIFTDASTQNWHMLENCIDSKHALMRFQCISYVHIKKRHLHKYFLQAITISPNRKFDQMVYVHISQHLQMVEKHSAFRSLTHKLQAEHNRIIKALLRQLLYGHWHENEQTRNQINLAPKQTAVSLVNTQIGFSIGINGILDIIQQCQL